MNAVIFNIQRFSIHDGPGIRTTVFMKGCPLRCIWCHNPESYYTKPQLSLNSNQCIYCGSCVIACPNRCHSFNGDIHIINRKNCQLCGYCVQTCPGALEIIGTMMSADQVLAEVEKDNAFYHISGGGMTVSGGEPLFHPDFLIELVQKAKSIGLHICLETSGFADLAIIRRIVPFIDLFLYDWKETDFELHKKFTGVGNEEILNHSLH